MVLYGVSAGFSLVTGFRSLSDSQQPANMIGLTPSAVVIMLLMPWVSFSLSAALLGMIVAMSAITSPGFVRWNSTFMMLFGGLMLVLAAVSYAYQIPSFSPSMAILAGVMLASGLGIAVWTNPYGRPRACPECGSRVIVWSKRGLTYCTSCEWYFGGIVDRESTSLMITGESGVGKSMLILKLAELFISRGKRCILVASDQPPAVIRKTTSEIHHSLPRISEALSEDRVDFTIVDSISSVGGLRSTERHHTSKLFDLDEIDRILGELCADNDKGSTIIIDSLNPLFMHRDAPSVLKFLSQWRARLLGKGGALLVSVTAGTLEQSIYKNIESMVDVIIEMQFAEGRLGHLHRFRLAKIRGQNVFDDWVYFEVLPEEGIVFQPIQRGKRSQKELGLLSWVKGPRR